MSLQLHTERGLATIVFDNPGCMNVMGVQEITELGRISLQLEDSPFIRVVVIRAEGPVFGAGGDLNCFHPGDAQAAERLRTVAAELNQAVLRMRRLPAIVITAVHGCVAGGSMAAMNVADLVIAAKGTRFNTAYARIGASPDAGASWFLPRLMGARKALECLLLADNFDADTALAYGLVNQVVPPEQLRDVTDKLAARLMCGPRESYAHMKRLVCQADNTSLAQQLEDETAAFVGASMSADFAEGVAAFLGKRSAHFGCKQAADIMTPHSKPNSDK